MVRTQGWKGMVVGLLLLLFITAPALAYNDGYGDSESHPLRLAAYALHPAGCALEWVVLRPLHAILSHPQLEHLFGHRPHRASPGCGYRPTAAAPPPPVIAMPSPPVAVAPPPVAALPSTVTPPAPVAPDAPPSAISEEEVAEAKQAAEEAKQAAEEAEKAAQAAQEAAQRAEQVFEKSLRK